jgi:hypothetical protein
MQKNLQPAAAEQAAAIKPLFRKHRKAIIITTSVIVLQFIFGFDPKFCIINIIWLFV